MSLRDYKPRAAHQEGGSQKCERLTTEWKLKETAYKRKKASQENKNSEGLFVEKEVNEIIPNTKTHMENKSRRYISLQEKMQSMEKGRKDRDWNIDVDLDVDADVNVDVVTKGENNNNNKNKTKNKKYMELNTANKPTLTYMRKTEESIKSNKCNGNHGNHGGNYGNHGNHGNHGGNHGNHSIRQKLYKKYQNDCPFPKKNELRSKQKEALNKQYESLGPKPKMRYNNLINLFSLNSPKQSTMRNSEFNVSRSREEKRELLWSPNLEQKHTYTGDKYSGRNNSKSISKISNLSLYSSMESGFSNTNIPPIPECYSPRISSALCARFTNRSTGDRKTISNFEPFLKSTQSLEVDLTKLGSIPPKIGTLTPKSMDVTLFKSPKIVRASHHLNQRLLQKAAIVGKFSKKQNVFISSQGEGKYRGEDIIDRIDTSADRRDKDIYTNIYTDINNTTAGDNTSDKILADKKISSSSDIKSETGHKHQLQAFSSARTASSTRLSSRESSSETADVRRMFGELKPRVHSDLLLDNFTTRNNYTYNYNSNSNPNSNPNTNPNPYPNSNSNPNLQSTPRIPPISEESLSTRSHSQIQPPNWISGKVIPVSTISLVREGPLNLNREPHAVMNMVSSSPCMLSDRSDRSRSSTPVRPSQMLDIQEIRRNANKALTPDVEDDNTQDRVIRGEDRPREREGSLMERVGKYRTLSGNTDLGISVRLPPQRLMGAQYSPLSSGGVRGFNKSKSNRGVIKSESDEKIKIYEQFVVS